MIACVSRFSTVHELYLVNFCLSTACADIVFPRVHTHLSAIPPPPPGGIFTKTLVKRVEWAKRLI